jgi:hypothetical protein
MLPALQSLLAGFVRRTWLVTLVAVLVCGGFAAHAVAALSEDVVAESLRSPRVAPAPRPAPRPPRIILDGAILVARNIFCSTCTNVTEPGPAGRHYDGQPAILIATNLGIESRATVRVVATDVQGDWTLGETIPGVGRVDRIGPTSIDVSDTAGGTARLSLLEALPGSGAATPGPAAAATTKPEGPYAGRIKQVADGVYEVDRALVRELVTGASKPTGVRALPVLDKNGDVKGVRMLGVRPDSVAGALGLKNGDVIAAIDGEPLRSAQQLLDLYAKLDQLEKVELTGTRSGAKALGLTLHLR